MNVHIKKLILPFILLCMFLFSSCATTNSFNGVKNQGIEEALASYSIAQIEMEYPKVKTIFKIDERTAFGKKLATEMRNAGYGLSDTPGEGVINLAYYIDTLGSNNLYSVILIGGGKKLSRVFYYDSKKNTLDPTASWSITHTN